MAKRATDTLDRAWRDVRRHMERAPEAPLLVYAFAEDSEPVRELVRRLRVALRARGVPVRHIEPSTPDDLRGTLGTIFDERGAVVVVDAPRADLDGGSAWADAWATVIARLNAGREQVRAELKGLVLAMPPAMRARAHATGPDLWSVHDVVCELGAAAPTSKEAVPSRAVGGAEWASPPATPPDVALAAAEAMEAREGRTEGWARTLIDALPGLVERGEAQRALQLGRAALAVLPREDARWPELLAAVAGAEDATGDPAAAVAHWQEAAEATDPLHPGAVWWLVRAGWKLQYLFLDHEADAVLRSAEVRARTRLSVHPSASTRRELAAVLDVRARALMEIAAGDAVRMVEEALELARANVLVPPGDPVARADLCRSLLLAGEAQAYSGELSVAEGRWVEALEVAQSLHDMGAREIPLETEALLAVGRLRLKQRRLEEAEGALDQAVELAEESVPRLRRVLLWSVSTKANVDDELGRHTDARLGHERAVRLARSLLGAGEPGAQDDLAVALSSLMLAEARAGNAAAALTAAREALELRRGLARIRDEDPGALRELVHALGNLALADRTQAASLVTEARATLASIAPGALPESERTTLSGWLDGIPTAG